MGGMRCLRQVGRGKMARGDKGQVQSSPVQSQSSPVKDQGRGSRFPSNEYRKLKDA
jgi:hypothetical protein